MCGARIARSSDWLWLAGCNVLAHSLFNSRVRARVSGQSSLPYLGPGAFPPVKQEGPVKYARQAGTIRMAPISTPAGQAGAGRAVRTPAVSLSLSSAREKLIKTEKKLAAASERAASTRPPVVDPAIPLSSFTWDAQSGVFSDAAAGYVFDPATSIFRNTTTLKEYQYDTQNGLYRPLSSGSSEAAEPFKELLSGGASMLQQELSARTEALSSLLGQLTRRFTPQKGAQPQEAEPADTASSSAAASAAVATPVAGSGAATPAPVSSCGASDRRGPVAQPRLGANNHANLGRMPELRLSPHPMRNIVTAAAAPGQQQEMEVGLEEVVVLVGAARCGVLAARLPVLRPPVPPPPSPLELLPVRALCPPPPPRHPRRRPPPRPRAMWRAAVRRSGCPLSTVSHQHVRSSSRHRHSAPRSQLRT